MRANFELLARLLIDVRRAHHREPLQPRRQGNWSAHFGAGPPSRTYDLAGGLIKNSMIKRLEPDSYVLTFHHLAHLTGNIAGVVFSFTR